MCGVKFKWILKRIYDAQFTGKLHKIKFFAPTKTSVTTEVLNKTKLFLLPTIVLKFRKSYKIQFLAYFVSVKRRDCNNTGKLVYQFTGKSPSDGHRRISAYNSQNTQKCKKSKNVVNCLSSTNIIYKQKIHKNGINWLHVLTFT